MGLKTYGSMIIRTNKKKIIIELFEKDFLFLAGKYKVKKMIKKVELLEEKLIRKPKTTRKKKK